MDLYCAIIEKIQLLWFTTKYCPFLPQYKFVVEYLIQGDLDSREQERDDFKVPIKVVA